MQYGYGIKSKPAHRYEGGAGKEERGVGIAKPFTSTIFRPILWAHFYARLPRCQGNADKMALKKQTKQVRNGTTACILCEEYSDTIDTLCFDVFSAILSW